MKWIQCLIVMCCLAPRPAQAAEPLRLTVEEAVSRAVRNHPSVQASAEAREAALAGVAEAEAAFAPALQAQAVHSTDRSPSVSTLEQVTTATTNAQVFTLGLVKPLQTGGRLALSVDQKRTADNAAFRTINPVYGSSVRLEFRQPLLRGRGRVNRTGIEVAEQGHALARTLYDTRLRQVAAEVRTAYWDLYLARANLEVEQQLLDGAHRVLETVQSQVQAGAEAPSTVLQARVDLAAREERVVVAVDNVRDREDRLRTLMAESPEDREREVLLVDSPSESRIEPDLAAGLRDARRISDRCAEAAARAHIWRLEAARARDASKPAVDLALAAELKGLGSAVGDPWHGLGDGEGRSWNGGLSFVIPLGGSVEQAQLARTLRERSQAELDLVDAARDLDLQVREQHRRLGSSAQRAAAARLAETLADQNVAEAEERLSLGLMTARDVLAIQDDLARAQMRRLEAEVGCEKASAEWERLTGREVRQGRGETIEY